MLRRSSGLAIPPATNLSTATTTFLRRRPFYDGWQKVIKQQLHSNRTYNTTAGSETPNRRWCSLLLKNPTTQITTTSFTSTTTTTPQSGIQRAPLHTTTVNHFATAAPKRKKSKQTLTNKTEEEKEPQLSDASATTNTRPEDHVFNIYVQIKEDHTLLPDHCYPTWLWTLEDKKKTYGELSMTFIYGKDIEQASIHDYRRFLRLHRKNFIKINNMRLKKTRRSAISLTYWKV